MISQKRSFRAALSAAICAFGISSGAILCPLTAFDLAAVGWPVLALVCLLSAVVCAAALDLLRPAAAFSVLGIMLGAFCFYKRREVAASFLYLAAATLEEYVKAFHFSLPSVLQTALSSGADATMALGILGALLCVVTCWTVISRCSLFGVFVTSLPFLIVCLVILQTEPATLPMLTLTGTLVLLTLTQTLRLDTTQSGYRLTLHLAVPVAALMVLLAVLFPRAGYERSEWSKSLAPMINQTAEKLTVFRENAATGQVEFVSPFTPSTLGRWVWDSSVTSVNLKRVGPQRKTGRRVMRVKSDYSAACHLRADSMAVYEDSTWRALKEGDYENSGVSDGVLLSPSKQTLGLSSGNSFEVRTDMKSSIFYVPYRPLELPTGGEAVFDAYIKNPSQLTDYTVSYAYVEETADRNAQYEAFVHETYTQLPDNVRAELEQILPQAQATLLYSSESPSLQKTARAIAKYVSESASYSLDTPRAPDGEDFALWFLRESDTGYCVHFATATVLLLRAAGIPARYVTGYYFTTQSGQWTDVLEDDAHAWVEYYLDGYGWQVLDPTPADLSSQTPETQPDTALDTQEPEPAEQTQPDEPSAPIEPAQPEPDTSETTDQAEASGNEPQNPAGKTALGAVWTVLFAALALCIWQVVLMGLRRAAFQTGTNNKRAVMLWRHIEFLCKLGKTEPPEDLHAVALKARFSQHKLSGEELSLLQAYSEETLEALVTKSSPPRRLFYAAVLALHKPLKR